MIACDNPECPIEWFHMDCISIEKLQEEGDIVLNVGYSLKDIKTEFKMHYYTTTDY